MRHDHVTEDHVHGLFFEQREGGFSTIGFDANEAQGFAYGHAELANGLFVIDNQQPDAEFFFG